MSTKKEATAPTRNKGGRPGKLTPDVQETILSAVKAGNYPLTAARAARVSEPTFYRWLALGREGKEPYRALVEGIKQAEGEAEVNAVAILHKAMPESWQAAMTFLERKFPSRWKRRDEIDLQGLPTDKLVALAELCDRYLESAGDFAALESRDFDDLPE